MRLALIQERQNALYEFHSERPIGSRDRVLELKGEMVDQNFALLERAAEAGADVALTSEAINYPGVPRLLGSLSSAELVACDQDDVRRRASRLARDAGMDVVVGMLWREGNGDLTNAAVVFDRRGHEAHRYRKNFLAGDEKDYMVAGRDLSVWEGEFGRVGVGICWDLQFPVTAQSFALQGADLVLCPTWGWEETYAAARAYENGVYVAAAMAVPSYKPILAPRAPSMVLSPRGETLVEGPRDEAGVVVADIEDVHALAHLREARMADLRDWLAEGRDACAELVFR